MKSTKQPTDLKTKTESVKQKVLILFAHPVYQTSLLNRSLLAALPDDNHITLHDLYEAYPNFMIDVAHEQQLLRQHDVIIFQHPLYWYSSPAIIKEWMDLVLEHGFAYGTEGTSLKNKQFMSIITSGGDKDNYLGDRGIRNLLKPFELTAELCQMNYLPPFVTYAGLKIKANNFDQEITEHYLEQQIKQYTQLINDLIHGRIDYIQCQSMHTINQHYEGRAR
ncbi:NAD(P)H-dependent oxidoreductase [Marinicella sp. S1101]|uniref:NAD(P)H-dependent oxidoreductase n=1 Tax=Marinicella marina TaxID=2996016 RepID=UPI002260CF35|nr:NAD(P)H-dependent oxidoreductase [Marinicella marina]MCX7554155.1 NAD(P)H-dependent oxidoreductase [Marinicella marina]MDJ1141152.1 NAD(P)H-dependent oxidoreductase [Marinicella marina]